MKPTLKQIIFAGDQAWLVGIFALIACVIGGFAYDYAKELKGYEKWLTFLFTGLVIALLLVSWLKVRQVLASVGRRNEFEICKSCDGLTPADFGYQIVQSVKAPVRHGFRPYIEDIYIKRQAVRYEERSRAQPSRRFSENDISELLLAGSSVLLIGFPMQGKTRTGLNLVRSLKGYTAIRPMRGAMPSDEAFLEIQGKDVVCVLDDLNSYVGASLDLAEFLRALNKVARVCVVIGTTRESFELDQNTAVLPIYEQFQERLFLQAPTEAEYSKLKKDLKSDKLGAPPSVGSLCMDGAIKVMWNRFSAMPSASKDAWRSIRLLVRGGIDPLSSQRVLAVMKHFFNAPLNGSQFRDGLLPLLKDGFLLSAPEEDPLRPEMAYFGKEFLPSGELDDEAIAIPSVETAAYSSRSTSTVDGAEALTELFALLLETDDGEGAIQFAGMRYREQEQDFAIDCWRRISDRWEASFQSTLKGVAATALTNTGFAYRQRSMTGEAIACYQKVIDLYGEATERPIRNQVAKALNNIGIAWASIGKWHQAIGSYSQVVERFASDPGPNFKHWVAMSLINLAGAWAQLGKWPEVLGCANRVIQSYAGDSYPGLVETVANARYTKGVALTELRLIDEALGSYDALISEHKDSLDVLIARHVGNGIGNAGSVSQLVGNTTRAIEYFQSGIDLYGKSSEPTLQLIAAQLLVNMGRAYAGIDDWGNSIKANETAIDRYARFPNTTLSSEVASAQLNRSFALAKIGRPAEAIAALEELAVRHHDSADAELRNISGMAKAMKNELQLGSF